MVAMTGEGPGMRPVKKPMNEPRIMGQNERRHSSSVGQSSRNRTVWSETFSSGSSAVTRTSEMPKSPMATGRKSTPWASVCWPKVKRMYPATVSMPTVPRARPDGRSS